MRAVPWSYYQNVVTYSYSFAWWSWERWEREIDWMALQGINLPLAFTGQETIWQKVFQKPDYNLTKEDLDAHFGGPAFLAWARMGNLHGWGGPLPQAWLDQQLEMQKRILARMRSLGMTPVLPAFAGHVPDALIAKFPSANITKTENWNTVNGDQRWCCTALLDPTDPLFRKIGESFLLEQIKEYGTNHIYNCDSFNENLPPTSEPSFISELGGAVFRAMLAADRDAIWLMQGWLFQSEAFFWKEPQMKALLHSVPLGRMLVLDLFAEVKPVWNRTNHFYGVPYIWCMLHNFGGNHEMYGTLESIASGPVAARTSTDSTMVGIGMAMEGIEHNPIVYDLMPEMAFHAEPLSVQEWVDDYVKRRYGGENYAAKEAWKILVATLYNCTDGIADHNGDVIVDPKDVPIPTSLYWHNRKTHRRALHGTRTDYETRKSGWENEEKGTAYERLLEGEGPMVGRAVHQWYDEEKVFHAAELLLSASTDYGDMETYRYDLVDVTRQVISKATNRLYGEMIDAFLKGDSEDVAKLGQSIVGAMADLDRLLATHEGFLLGPWLEGAKSFAKTEEEAALYEWNARTQITMWYDTTPTQPSSLHDYANKMWSGLLKNYYLPRMALFVSLLRNAARAKKPFPVTEWQRNWVAFSRRWQAGRELHSTAAEGDSMRLVTVLLKKYLPLAGNGSSGLAKSPNMGLQVSWS